MPTTTARAEAELSLSLLMCLAREIPHLSEVTKTGVWMRTVFHELPGRTLGLIGFGPAARELAGMLGGFGLRCLAWDENPDKAAAERLGVRLAPLDEVVRQSHYLSIHIPHAGKKILDAAKIDAMREGAFIVNVSAEALVDEAGIERALAGGRLAGYGACLSAPKPEHPLNKYDSFICAPALRHE
ncbi:MAG: hypothetical protein LBU23_01935 [Planctomycetota bacterium]|jgi:D-3-phosphoglycerate dehydrogenase|nr:hypothetical protein [Planctomycetota bacterium]